MGVSINARLKGLLHFCFRPITYKFTLTSMRIRSLISRWSSTLTPHDDVAAHLKRARELIVRKGVWTQDAYARDRSGSVVNSQSPDATSFCSSGALFATELPGVTSVASRALLGKVIQADLEVWNDTPGRKQQEIVKAFDQAIRLAESTRH